ncbi:hypothetical protein GCG54_00010740 [Colletotrichum gloeosporioides]|uniref:non-specific serine/threonine protein kinase n=1 Tax=Colletotrichum gloeosporioides TaxID=474922 RepID=A0A8H4FDR2_COLGL|nr:uncharacterized protein GCG54_00010740 [Colletotrichum gloeosporioides]KAF3798588.1 hypothetical protein GCG54_00010740 [Colletotrichum gloeosporioides]
MKNNISFPLHWLNLSFSTASLASKVSFALASTSATIIGTPDKFTGMIPGAEFKTAAIELVAANPTWTIDELEQAEGILFDAPEEYLSDYAQGGFHPVQLGDRLEYGRYIVFHKLGHGGFSTVWLGHDGKLGRNVAIKILKADVAGWTNDGYNFGPSVFGTPITFKMTPSATMVQMALTCASSAPQSAQWSLKVKLSANAVDYFHLRQRGPSWHKSFKD